MKILYFEADWCCQCKAMKSHFIDECKRLNIKEDKIQYINAEENDELVKKYKIRTLPTLVFLDDKENLVDKEISMNAYKQIEKYVRKIDYETEKNCIL